MFTIITNNQGNIIMRNGTAIAVIHNDGSMQLVGRSRRPRISLAILRQAGANEAVIEAMRSLDREHEASRTLRRTSPRYFNNSHTYGIEIECFCPVEQDRPFRYYVAEALRAAGIEADAAGYHASGHQRRGNSTTWWCEYDASVGPDRDQSCEVVSPILRGEDGFALITKVMQVIQSVGGKVDSTCGLHVHHGKFRGLQPLKVLNTFRNNEVYIDMLLSPGRRADRNRYARTMSRCEDLADWDRAGKYSKLNYQHWSDYGTIEFRCHQGTLNPTKAIAWIKFTQAIMNASELKQADNLEDMLTKVNVSPEVKEYFLNRAQALA